MTEIVCDSSSLISLGNTCLIRLIPYLKEEHNVKFIIPKSVEKETVKKPLKTKRYKLLGLKINKLIKKGQITVLERDEALNNYTNKFLELTNSLLTIRENEKPIKLLHKGETEAISTLKHIGTNNLLVDERNTRLIIEDINTLRDHISTQLKRKINIDEETQNKIQIETNEINVLRSTELAARAYELGYFSERSRDLLEGTLYGLKFSGCAIQNKEIHEYLNHIGQI